MGHKDNKETLFKHQIGACRVDLSNKGEYPILLLDDVFSELDKIRQNQLIKTLNKYVQTIITTATLSDIDKGLVNQAKLIELKEGGGYRDAK